MSQVPTIGRIVHVHLQHVAGDITNHAAVTKTYAALITDVGEGTVALVAFVGHELRHLELPFSDEPAVNHWSWPRFTVLSVLKSDEPAKRTLS